MQSTWTERRKVNGIRTFSGPFAGFHESAALKDRPQSFENWTVADALDQNERRSTVCSRLVVEILVIV